MAEPLRIDVRSAARTYAVLIGDGLSERLPAALDAASLPARRILVSNPVVWRFHGAAIARGMPGAETILLPDGERHKHLLTASRLYDALVGAAADRASAVVAVGGGVLGDVAGFGAATYLRGVGLAHVPTTLLAQVDSAIGGKVGVNHALGKNLIGAFYPPWVVVIDPALLRTLPRREFRAGLYEVVKYGMIADGDLFARVRRDLAAIFARDAAVLTPVIATCCRIKARVVEADEREGGVRRILNFGHTAGHALEAITKYRRFRHGEAIGYGMLVAASLGRARGVLAGADADALRDLIVKMGPMPAVGDLSARQAVEAMGRDKKYVDGTLHYVLASAIGRTETVADVGEKELLKALKSIGMKA